MNKIKIQYISDIHLEFHKKEIKNISKILTPSAPYLAILGDVGYPRHDKYQKFFQLVNKYFEKIFYVAGNHEYYTHKKSIQTVDEINQEIKKTCDQFPNIYFLNNSCHELNNEYVLLGTTLWSDTSNNPNVEYCINDYNNIYVSDKKKDEVINVTTKDTTQFFKENVEWLTKFIDLIKGDKKIIILSHHLPSYQLIAPQYIGSAINSAFASNLDYVMEQNDNIKYWLCGHTHSNMNAKINNCWCLVNPCGYPGENKYQKDATIELL